MKFSTLLFFILVYFNQGISSLSGQCEYYLIHEHWGLSLTMLGVIGFITGLPWSLKIAWGFLADYVPIKKYKTKYYLFSSYFLMLASYAWIIIFGLNIWSLIITGFIINCCIGMCDVINDKKMVILEREENLQGKLQACQWTSLGVAGLIVSIGGAFIADYFSIEKGYRVAYFISAMIPILTLLYLKKNYKEEICFEFGKNKKSILNELKLNLKDSLKIFKDKQILLSLLFIVCLQLCPSFGSALMDKVRSMGVSKMYLGYVGASSTVMGLIGYVLYYWKAYKFEMKKLLIFMVIFSALTNLFYLYIPNKEILIFYNVLFGAFSGITFLTLLRFFTTLIPKGSEGITYAIITSISNFAGRGSNLLGGYIADTFGYEATVIISTILTMVCLFFIPKLNLTKEKLK